MPISKEFAASLKKYRRAKQKRVSELTCSKVKFSSRSPRIWKKTAKQVRKVHSEQL